MGIVSVFKTLGWFNNAVDMVQQFCTACVQLLQDSDILKELYADDQETVAGVRYLNLVTRHDEMVTPFTNGLMKLDQKEAEGSQTSDDSQPASPLSESRNLVIEDYCPQDTFHANHFRLFRSPFAFSAADAFFSHRAPGSLQDAIQCSMQT